MYAINLTRNQLAVVCHDNPEAIRAFEKLIADEGSQRFTVIDVDGDITVGESQIILADASSGNITVSLPQVSTVNKYRYIIKKIDSTSNEVIVTPSGVETIDGEATMIINTQYDAMQIVPSGSEWSIV